MAWGCDAWLAQRGALAIPYTLFPVWDVCQQAWSSIGWVGKALGAALGIA